MENQNKGCSRKNFIKMNSLAGLGLLVIRNSKNNSKDFTKIHGEISDLSEGALSSGPKITTIGGQTLEQLRAKYRKELFNNYLPNMDKYAIDHEYGGVMCNLDVRTGKLENTNKTAWFVGRGMWVYSFLYNNLEKSPHYLDIARKSKDLLLKMQPKDGSFWTKEFTREGKPLTGPGDIYGSLFTAEGLAEYAVASGEKQYRQIAKKIIFDCLARYDEPDYFFSYGDSYFHNAPAIRGPRILGHWMIFLSLSTQMLVHEPDADLEKLTTRCVDAILKHHVNPEYVLTNEVLNHDLSLPDNAYSQFSITGHGLETIGFVMAEAARRKDTKMFQNAEPVFKKIVDVTRDALYGGYFHALQQVDNYIWSLRKSLWCQQEVLNGAIFLTEHTGDEWAMRQFAKADEYIFGKFFNPDNKFWYSGGDRKMVNPNTKLLEHYHHARQLMKGLLSIERMLKRKGEISGMFS